MVDKQIIKDFFKQSYPEYFGNKPGGCSYIYNVKGKGPFKRPHQGCGAYMRSAQIKANDPDGFFYSSLLCRYEDLYSAAIEYWNYITSTTESPWKDGLFDIEILYDDKGRPICFGTTNHKNNPQCFGAVAIQARVPHEHSNKLRSFAWWRKNGFSKPVSLFLSECIAVHVDGSLSWLDGSDYKHAINTTTNGKSFYGCEFDLESFLACKPKVDQRTYATTGAYAPLHTQFGIPMKSGDQHITERLKSALKGDTPYAGVFSKMFATITGGDVIKSDSGLVSKESAIPIIKSFKEFN